jgi:hypothetical protein
MKNFSSDTIFIKHNKENIEIFTHNVEEKLSHICLIEHRCERLEINTFDNTQNERDKISFYLLGVLYDKEIQKEIKKLLVI